MTKKEIASIFGVEPTTMRAWIRKGLPSHRVDEAHGILTRRARANECQIQGSPYAIKCGLRGGDYFKKCLKMAFPGVW